VSIFPVQARPSRGRAPTRISRMHIELVDSLRCPVPHEDTWLVASVTRFDGRDIVEGVLGCPSCRRHYEVRRGEVDFSGGEGSDAAPVRQTQSAAAAESETDRGVRLTGAGAAPSAPTDEDVLRARALLALDEPGGIVLLGGSLARFAQRLADEVQVATIVLNAPEWLWREGGVPSAIRSRNAIPVAGGVLRAVWFDDDTATPELLAGAARALRPGGRLMAPATAQLPAGAGRLAGDAEQWVAEATAAPSAPVPLRRR